MTAEERLTENLRLFLSNEQGIHVEAGCLVRHAERRAARRRREVYGQPPATEMKQAVQGIRAAAGAALQGWVGDLLFDDDGRAQAGEGIGAAIAADLLSVALAFVDWPALAESLENAGA